MTEEEQAVPEENKERGFKLYKLLVFVVPAALVSFVYYLSIIYISMLREGLGIHAKSLPITVLDTVEAVFGLVINHWFHLAIASIIFLFFWALYKLSDKVKIDSTDRVVLVMLAAFPVIMGAFYSPVLIIERVESIASAEATRIKEKINKEDNLSTITLNDKVVAKGVIVGMSESMVWIYDGKETTAMAIGAHKIIRPVPVKKKKTAN